MKLISLLLAALLLTSCARRPSEVIVSPDSHYSVRTEISGDDAGPTLRLCVRLKVTDLSTAKEMVFQTDASDVQKWALTWAPPSVLVLYSSDVGTMSYDIKDGTLVERQATAEEKVLGRSAYEAKYKR